MRIFIFTIILISVAVTTSFAEENQDCAKVCADDKSSNDINCPLSSVDNESDSKHCLEKNELIYTSCKMSCYPPLAAPDPPPAALPVPPPTDYPGVFENK